jgi:hypothetical protein
MRPEQYLVQRLNSARGLARYFVESALRSSRAALFEHIRGTDAACARVGITSMVKKASTGNVIGTLEDLRGRPPRSYLGVELPAWLANRDAHARACDEEIVVYERIEELLQRLSDDREVAKTDMLVQRRKTHPLVLAFDSYLITLHDISRRLLESGEKDVILATGETKGSRAQVQKKLALGSDATGIALCSDALAEGVNLQAASAVAMLDMPTVVRLAEQRIGRIDRMDTPHAAIEVFWPNDAEEFAPRAAELLLDRMKDVADLLGSNVPLPPHLAPVDLDSSIRAEEMQKLLARYGAESAGDVLKDAFQSVRGLIDGENALVRPDVYRSVRNSRVQLRTAVSVLQTDQRWGFYALSAAGMAPPRWMFVDGSSAEPLTDLDLITARLRERLAEPIERELDERAGKIMAEDLALLQRREEYTLPQRKRRALKLMREVLESLRAKGRPIDPEMRSAIRDVLDLVAPVSASRSDATRIDEPDEVVDLEVVADWWIDLIRPVWQKHLQNPRRRRPARLAELERPLIDAPPTAEQLRSLFDAEVALYTQPLARRVAAAIVGVPN